MPIREWVLRGLTLVAWALCVSPLHAQRGAPPRLVKEIVLGDGSRADDVPGGFTGIGAVLVGRNGDIYVSQPRDNLVQQFDSSGKYVRAIGRKGQGPGETERFWASGFLGDTLWTLDGGTGRFSMFSPAGVFYSAFRTPGVVIANDPPRFHAEVSPSALLAGGRVYFGSFTYFPLNAPSFPPWPEIVADRDGTHVDTLLITPFVDRGRFVFPSSPNPVFDNGLYALLNTRPIVEAGGDGAWLAVALQNECATKPRFRVAKVSVRGDSLWRGTIACSTEVVPRGFVDSVVAAIRAKAVKQHAASEADAEKVIRATIGTVTGFASLRGVRAGRDGSIWARPLTLHAGPEEWVRVDAKSGEFDHFVLPARTSLMLVADSTHIWAMALDQDDVPTLVRYRLVR